MQYQAEGLPLVMLAGKEYGSGSSREWAAKGSQLLGVRAVIAESFERIHRSNLVGMGVLPLQFVPGEPWRCSDYVHEVFVFGDRRAHRRRSAAAPGPVTADGTEFETIARIHTPFERDVFLAGGILPYTLRRLATPEELRHAPPAAGRPTEGQIRPGDRRSCGELTGRRPPH